MEVAVGSWLAQQLCLCWAAWWFWVPMGEGVTYGVPVTLIGGCSAHDQPNKS